MFVIGAASMKNVLAIVMLSVLITACGSTSINIFSKKTPHEQYAEKLDDTNLEDTPEGREWLAVAKTALENAHAIKLPYIQQGYFAPDKPRALGLKFTAKRGEKITFNLSRKAPLTIYADIFKKDAAEPRLLLSADTAASEFSMVIEETGPYILRLQPELFQSGEYRLSVSIGPSLGFPVAQNKGKVGSVWCDARDGGKRKHEGIDIFAPKRTPVIAAADGVVTGVKNEGIGGKTVWLRTEKNISLYYAPPG
jgi:murein DD-endopeptidase MepM/ murein hydrolase activator NlpD